MNEKVTIAVEEITPEIAEKYIDSNYEGNRRLNQAWVNQLANDMKSGKFRLNPSAPIIFTTEGKLIDGQHRLWACIQSETPFEAYVFRNCDEELYKVIDIGKTRTTADLIGKRKHATRIAALVNKILATKEGTLTISSCLSGRLSHASRNESDGKSVSVRVSKPAQVEEAEKHYDEYVGYIETSQLACAAIGKKGWIELAYFLWLCKWLNRDALAEEFVHEIEDIKNSAPCVSLMRTRLLQLKGNGIKMTPQLILGYLLTTYEAYCEGKNLTSHALGRFEKTLDRWTGYVREKRKNG